MNHIDSRSCLTCPPVSCQQGAQRQGALTLAIWIQVVVFENRVSTRIRQLYHPVSDRVLIGL